MIDLRVALGPIELRTPLVAASGTVGAVVDQLEAVPFENYGAAVAKSVSRDPWPGNAPPRLAPAGVGMLNAVGVQNPGIEHWLERYGPLLSAASVPTWGSAIGTTTDEFVQVAKGLQTTDVQAIELNLSCPNVEGGSGLFALDPVAAAEVVRSVKASVDIPVSAKLSPNAQDIVAVASAVAEAGSDWVVLTNTIWGAGIDIETRSPVVSGGVGGFSGPPLKPIAMRCVIEVHRALPELPIVGCGGVRTAEDAVEYLLAGASAVGVGTAHFESPRVGARIRRGLDRYCRDHGYETVAQLIGAAEF